jgi:hypothetical protein
MPGPPRATPKERKLRANVMAPRMARTTKRIAIRVMFLGRDAGTGSAGVADSGIVMFTPQRYS